MSKSIFIRNLKLGDSVGVIELWRGTPGIEFFCGEDRAEAITKYIERNPGLSFVAMADDRIIGSIMVGHDGWLGFIHHLCVHPNFRGRGLAKQLTEKAVEALAGEGIGLVSFVVKSDNEIGNAFWEKNDFVTRPDLLYRNKKIGMD